jgi:hypothetical protein
MANELMGWDRTFAFMGYGQCLLYFDHTDISIISFVGDHW